MAAAFDSLITKVLGKAACTPDVLGKSYDNLSCTTMEQRLKAAQSVFFKAFRQGSWVLEASYLSFLAAVLLPHVVVRWATAIRFIELAAPNL